ncbi:MAG: hypothetical protein RKP46_11725 [Candidatus Accumulibacter sp.]|uniref:hypothetical protein n=1 Tax=Accumulibacter sp. TaxID=2053492 RepID=UPI0028798597|nr:hypothetical protein [Accumulibacter sp.]MDS4015000.1 hypothetical protein [Accumulibacter sp.]
MPDKNRTAQCHKQDKARTMPHHAQTGIQPVRLKHGARIADVAQHNAYGKRPLAALRGVSAA